MKPDKSPTVWVCLRGRQPDAMDITSAGLHAITQSELLQHVRSYLLLNEGLDIDVLTEGVVWLGSDSGSASLDEINIDDLKHQLGSVVLEGLNDKPAYEEHLPAEVKGMTGCAIAIIVEYLISSEECRVVVFCPVEGAKLCFMRHEDRIFFTFLRSGVRDDAYSNLLKFFYEDLDLVQLEKEFQELLPFNSSVVVTVCDRVRELAGVEKHAPLEFEAQLTGMARWYARSQEVQGASGKGDASPYAQDIRVFSLMRAYRRMLCDMQMHLLLVPMIERDDPEPIRLYVYHTGELVPERPPIYACPAYPGMRRSAEELLRRLWPEDKDQIRDDNPAQRSQLAAVVGYKHLKHHGRCYTCVVDDGGQSGTLALLEVSGPRVTLDEARFAKEGLRAALDPTYCSATRSLCQWLPLATVAAAQSFDRYASLFTIGLSARPGREPQVPPENAWQKGLHNLCKHTRYLPPGSLTSAEADKLQRVLEHLCDHWDSVESSEDVAQKRAGIRPLAEMLEDPFR